MTVCPGCAQPLEPLAQIRSYHTQCDPQGRVEMLERVLRPFVELANSIFAHDTVLHMRPRNDDDGIELMLSVREVRAACAALDYKPAQIKGRE